MSHPWNRFPWEPSITNFDAGANPLLLRPSSNSGILGNLAEITGGPRGSLLSALMHSDALEWPRHQNQQHPWLDADSLKFLAAGRSLYSPSLLPLLWPANNLPGQTILSEGADQYDSTPAPFNVSRQPPIPAAPFDQFHGGRPTISPQLGRANDVARPDENAPSTGAFSARPPRATFGSTELFPQLPETAPRIVPDGPQSFSDGNAKDDPQVLADAIPDNDWIPGADYVADGHHWFPRANYKGKKVRVEDGFDKLPPETRKVFDKGITGRFLLHSLDGRRHVNDAFHRQYNEATKELLDEFMRENNIFGRPDLLTPDHAVRVLQAIADSEEPRIKMYRNFIRQLMKLPALRSGARGSE